MSEDSTENLGCYPQKPLFGLRDDGVRYKIAVGFYCYKCGWPADRDIPLFMKRAVCSLCDELLKESHHLLRGYSELVEGHYKYVLWRAAKYARDPFVLGSQLMVERFSQELFESNLVRYARYARG